MTFNSFILILTSQLKAKWGRFILASGGIMIGVWAITLTTGLSLGLRETLVQAINSRPEARFLQVYKTSATSFNFSDINAIPTFQGISESDLNELKNQNPQIISTVPSLAAQFAFRLPGTPADFSCNSVFNQIQESANGNFSQPNPQNDVTVVSQANTQYQANCAQSYITLSDFDYLYEVNRSNWYGDKQKPTGDNIVICFSCGSLNLGSKLGYSKPEDMVGKQVQMEAIQAADQYVFEGEEYSIIDGTSKPTTINSTDIKTFTISAVVDDREPGLSIGFSNMYLPYDYYLDSIKLANVEAQTKEPLYVEYSFFVDDFSQLKPVTDNINETPNYLANALVLILVDGINNLFLGLTVVLSMLGFIAFVASIFGIITVMFISVLERKKEIGILKSLGARNSDIFFIFLLESCALGMVGWILGIALSTITSLAIQGSVYLAIQNIEALRNGLGVLNITSFAPVLPWWIYLGTLGLAVFFTSVSGLIPSFNAARQNPVEVLRSE